MAKKIKLSNGKYVIVDNEDYPYLKKFNWTAESAGMGNFYAVRRIITHHDQKFLIGIEYFIVPSFGEKHSGKIVHKNYNSLDCRKENLDWRMNAIAVHNKRKTTHPRTSIYKGVSWSKSAIVGKQWVSKIGYKYKSLWIGGFATEKEAALAYNEKAKELYGEFAYQNKII